MDKIKIHIRNLLANEFPAWTPKDIDSLSVGLISDYLKKNFGDDSLIISGLYEAILAAKKARKNVEEINPGYIRSIFLQKVVKLWEDIYKRPDNFTSVAVENNSESDEESEISTTDLFPNSLQEQLLDFDAQTSLQKIRQFAKNIIASNELSDKELKVFKCIVQAAENDALFPAINETNKKWNIKDFWNEVKSELNKEGIWLNDSDFRTTKHRIRGRINTKLRDSEGFLHQFTKEQLESVFSSSSTFLRAYRLSDEELDKMIWLKKEVFEKNGFSFDPNRFPEVYYGSFEEYKSIRKVHDVSDRSEKVFIEDEEGWKKIADAIHNIKHSKEKELTANQIETLKKNINPDALGFYVPDYTNDDCRCGNESGKIVNEGYIILFKERIEELSETIALIEGTDFEKVCKSIRFNVLMHELGHWITHWAWHLDFDINVFQDINWKCNYYWNSLSKTAEKKTHEALAQLITYWSVLGNNFDRQIFLDYLTPTDPLSEYRLYLKLIDFSKNEVLNKTKVLRTLCDISDEIKERYLSSDSISFHEYLSKELFNEIRNQPCNLGDGVQLSNIEATNKKLLLHLIKEIDKLKTNTSIDSSGRMYLFQHLFLKMEKGEKIDDEIKTLWNESKKHFGSYNESKGTFGLLGQSLVF